MASPLNAAHQNLPFPPTGAVLDPQNISSKQPPLPNMAATNFGRITNVSLMKQICQIELIAILHKSRRHQSVFVTSEYSSSTTTTTTSRHLLQTHRCTKERGEFTLLDSHWLGCGGCHLNGRGVRN